MCDMQKMPTADDASCEEEAEMNFATFSAVGGGGTHYVTTNGQIPVTKLQQNITNNGMSQVVNMGGGMNMIDRVQYLRTLDPSGQLQGTPQLISVPIAMPGTKPGDPQQTVQIQVLNPNLTLQQPSPKYQMHLPIQGFQQGGTVLTLAYAPDGNDSGGIQLIGNSLPDGVQLLVPQEMQLVQPQQTQENNEQNIQHQAQVYITADNQVVINGIEAKPLNNNTRANNNNEIENIIIKEECVENMDEESSQSNDANKTIQWQVGNNSQDLFKNYLDTFSPKLVIPDSLQQFLKIQNKTELKKEPAVNTATNTVQEASTEVITGAIIDEDGTVHIQNKKKKKYKKKPPKPARQKPGHVIIANAADGTPIFCCPECQMAYPDKSQLEAHLSVHKIERRFICGLCGAALKRKEHLERHKLGHNPERPYVCGACGKGFKRREHLNLHAVIHSGVKTEMCGQCGKGFYRKDHLRKHTRSHEVKRARDEANELLDKGAPSATVHTVTPTAAPVQAHAANVSVSTNTTTMLPEITIHVPTSSNTQVPVQINIPQHVMSSLAAAQAAQAQAHTQAQDDAHAQLDALLAHHT